MNDNIVSKIKAEILLLRKDNMNKEWQLSAYLVLDILKPIT